MAHVAEDQRRQDEAVRALTGTSYRDIGELLARSFQRVAQSPGHSDVGAFDRSPARSLTTERPPRPLFASVAHVGMYSGEGSIEKGQGSLRG